MNDIDADDNCDRQPVSTVDAMNALTVLRGRLVKSYPDLSRHHSRADLCFVSPSTGHRL